MISELSEATILKKYNSKKLKKNFNFNFNTNIDKGLLNFYKWIKKNIKFATKLKS